MKNFDIPTFYTSALIAQMKRHRQARDRKREDLSPFCFDFGAVRFFLPRDFGFCYGVKNAIDIIYQVLDTCGERRVFVLSELIHNDEVNRDLLRRGVQFLMDTSGKVLISFDHLHAGDIVIVPAFGTTLETQQALRARGVDLQQYDTTCPFVRKVWNKSSELAHEGYTIIIHGKHYHEETRATFSRVCRAGAPCVIVRDVQEAELLAKYIRGEKNTADFYRDFAHKHSLGFIPEKDLKKIGVVNQTTMLASETKQVAHCLKTEILSLEKDRAFADTRDTLCYATSDNQNALGYVLRTEKLDKAFVLGGYKSSNTTNLFRFCAEFLPAYFIEDERKIISSDTICHFDYHDKIERTETIGEIAPAARITNILIVLGASCPDILAEKLMYKIAVPLIGEARFSAILRTLYDKHTP